MAEVRQETSSSWSLDLDRKSIPNYVIDFSLMNRNWRTKMNMPGFTAELACDLVSTTHYRTNGGYSGEAMPAVTPQMWADAPFWTCDENHQNCRWVTTSNWYDDPGGWGVPPWIGDVSGRQCIARCNKIKNPQAKADCLDIC